MTTNEIQPGVVYMQTAEDMSIVPDGCVNLLIGGGVFLDTGDSWDPYAALFNRVYNEEGLRVLGPDGVFFTMHTNAYSKGVFIDRCHMLRNLLDPDWVMIDERIWKRRAADHMQVPFSHAMVFKKRGGRVTRTMLNKRSRAWFQGVWEWPQTKGGAQNGWPLAMSEVVVEACSMPGDIVLDPLAGGATVLMAASAAGRQAFGFEIDKSWMEHYRKSGLVVVDGDAVYYPEE